MNKIKILDIKFDVDLVNISRIATQSNLSYSYTRELIHGIKGSTKGLLKVRNAIITLYGSIVTFSVQTKISKSANKSTLKKIG